MCINKANCIVVVGTWVLPSDVEVLFPDQSVHYTDTTELSRLMVELGVYPSTSKARRDGRCGDIPTGYTEYKANKKRYLEIWNPTEDGYMQALEEYNII